MEYRRSTRTTKEINVEATCFVCLLCCAVSKYLSLCLLWLLLDYIHGTHKSGQMITRNACILFDNMLAWSRSWISYRSRQPVYTVQFTSLNPTAVRWSELRTRSVLFTCLLLCSSHSLGNFPRKCRVMLFPGVSSGEQSLVMPSA